MITHGTPSAYQRWGCRCVVCRSGHAERAADRRRRYAMEGVPDFAPHGTYSTYINYSCRCPECVAARRAYQRRE